MAASGAPERRPRRGPAPIASFDHDVSEESSPETKQTFRLPEIREDSAGTSSKAEAQTSCNSLAPPEQRARSHSSPAVHGGTTGGAVGGLQTPSAPRIDISRASSSSHQDSRDSSPELALFTGGTEGGSARLELGFREDGALELRSSTEELAFLEGAPGESRPAPPPSVSRRHSRKDSQSSEAALLAVSGRTSRLSSVGSQCSAHSALSAFSHTSRVSHLSVVSGTSRSPSPHKMLLETSFCGPKPIETDPEICAAAVEERLLEIAKLTSDPIPTLLSSRSSAPESVSVVAEISAPSTTPLTSTPTSTTPATGTQEAVPEPLDARDHREVRTEVTVESTRPPNTPRLTSPAAPLAIPLVAPARRATCSNILDEDKRQKETLNRARVEERRARSRERSEQSQSEKCKSNNRSKDIIRIKLKPDHEYDDEDDDDESERTLVGGEQARKPATLELRQRSAAGSPAPTRPRDCRTPSPLGAPVSRKSSFCSLFKSRETIASPESPCDVLRRKKSLNEGRSRSKSRDRSTTPTSASKIKGSVLSLFKTPKKSGTSPSPTSRDGSPGVQPQRSFPHQHVDKSIRGEKLKYYEDSKDGIIHIPLRTPSDEICSPSAAATSGPVGEERQNAAAASCQPRGAVRPSSAPQPRPPPERPQSTASTSTVRKPTKRTVLPDGSIIIPLHSPTEKTAEDVQTPNITTSPGTNEPSPERASPPGAALSGDRCDSAALHDDTAPRPERASGPVPSEAARVLDDEYRKRRERIIFTTHVGSREQVFCTQFSITKTPSVTSEISESIKSFVDSEETRIGLRDTHIAAESPVEYPSPHDEGTTPPCDGGVTPERDSSGSEADEAEHVVRSASEVERRGLVVQESFEEELPFVPTTLPSERSLALPMVPVRERSGVRVAGVQRPRAPRPAAAPPAPPPPRAPPAEPPSPPAPPGGPPDKLRIRLPRRTRTASASAPPRPERPRTSSGGDEILVASEMRKKADWIDFEDVPERRKQPKRIQTLPAPQRTGAASAGPQYAAPEQCRCECHARRDDELPLLAAEDPPDDPRCQT
ncbi:serine/arginine repetitive matrix protein 1 [Papilio machaon]|uniref:serine/arginine repetitive matrix protein 1 n=1 Tax=Papilio machaon TaxID=76193 RepID=UPI001E665F4B|nr:serine/arginine repetitive matrix protein 1 [Papilio machaon]